MCTSGYLFTLIGLCLSQSIFVESRQIRGKMVCTEPDPIPNGRVRMRRTILHVICNTGFLLQGQSLLPCIDGKWVGEKPVCAKRGCKDYVGKEMYPRISSSPMKATAVCPADYELFGNNIAYCNGTSWDRELGVCKVRKGGAEFECDFEGEDLCGWTSDVHDFLQWSRRKASHIFTSVQTGPHHDHTTMSATGGHYMLMESTDIRRNPKPILFTSPIYNHSLSMKTACCFRFYYFMYGSGVGSLSVYVKPALLEDTDMLNARDKYLKFVKSGNHGDRWHEAKFDIDETEEDFQIVFAATKGSAFSDIAIDDLKLMIGSQCNSGMQTTSTDDYTTEVADEAVFDSQSCASRCYQRTGLGFVEKDGHIKITTTKTSTPTTTKKAATTKISTATKNPTKATTKITPTTTTTTPKPKVATTNAPTTNRTLTPKLPTIPSIYNKPTTSSTAKRTTNPPLTAPTEVYTSSFYLPYI